MGHLNSHDVIRRQLFQAIQLRFVSLRLAKTRFSALSLQYGGFMAGTRLLIALIFHGNAFYRPSNGE